MWCNNSMFNDNAITISMSPLVRERNRIFPRGLANKNELVALFRHEYMILNRCQMDVEYYLGWGNGDVNRLFFDTPQEHIEEMIKLWKLLPAKPVWLRACELIEYKARILSSVEQ